MEKVFLAKIKDSSERDCVKYIEFRGFECDHYFSGIHICGACFYGAEKEFREFTENHFEDLETILTKEEILKIFELNDELKDLGYGIDKGSEKYNKGLEIIKEFKETIEKKLLSEENEQLFQKVIADEKEYTKNEYNLINSEVEEIFNNYGLEYRDRAIVCAIFDDFDEMVEEEKFELGYDEIPYFDDKAFGNDLLNSEYYLELESGKIVYYAY